MIRVVILTFAFLLAAPFARIGAHAALPAQANRPPLQVALTFDDLPVTGGTCDTAMVRDVTRRLTAGLRARRLPSAGLVTPGRDCLTPALLQETLQQWQAVGAVIGNHTATHPDLNETSIEDYLANLDRGQRLIDAAVKTEGRWFRPPYLHSGNDSASKRALARHLTEHGYRVAPVTVDNQEWVYAAVYADARARGDVHLAERVADGYLAHLEESMAFYERLSTAMFGRTIPQVLLLHANLLNADLLDRVVTMLESRGYGFISLPQAVADPAYARTDTYTGPQGLSWIQRWALEDGVEIPPEPREAQWVAEEFRRMRQRNDDEAAVRTALEHYLAGHATGLGAHFDSAFHDVAQLFWIDGGDLRSRTSESYIAGAGGRPAANEADRRRRIEWVEVTGDAAVARIDLDYPGVFITDYMSLLRVGDEWRIVNKIYHVDRSGRRSATGRSPEAGAAGRAADAARIAAASRTLSAPNADDAARIAAASRAFSAAYIAGDTATIRELYTESAVLLPPERDVFGAAAVSRYFAPGARRRNLAHRMESESLEIVGDRALDLGMWHNTWQIGDDEPQSATGRYLVVWHRGADGRWRIHYDMWHRPRS